MAVFTLFGLDDLSVLVGLGCCRSDVSVLCSWLVLCVWTWVVGGCL